MQNEGPTEPTRVTNQSTRVATGAVLGRAGDQRGNSIQHLILVSLIILERPAPSGCGGKSITDGASSGQGSICFLILGCFGRGSKTHYVFYSLSASFELG